MHYAILFALTWIITLLPAAFGQDIAQDKWKLWSEEKAHLRGANIFQKTLPDGSWCSVLHPNVFQKLRDTGANYVNLSVPGTFNITPAKPFDAKQKWSDRYFELPSARDSLDNLVKWAGATTVSTEKIPSPLWTVISLRSAPGRSQTDLVTEPGVEIVRDLFSPNQEISRDARAAFAAMWQTLAERFKDKPHIAAYDLLVEPHRAETNIQEKGDANEFMAEWRKIAIETIQAIRKVDATTPIIVGLPEYSYMSALKCWKPLFPEDKKNHMRIVYGLHQYVPFEATHGNVALLKEDFQKMEDQFTYIDNWKKENPEYAAVFTVNEFGVKTSLAGAEEFITKEMEILNKRGMNHAIWLWDPEKGDCFAPDMAINANTQFLEAVKNGWLRKE